MAKRFREPEGLQKPVSFPGRVELRKVKRNREEAEGRTAIESQPLAVARKAKPGLAAPRKAWVEAAERRTAIAESAGVAAETGTPNREPAERQTSV